MRTTAALAAALCALATLAARPGGVGAFSDEVVFRRAPYADGADYDAADWSALRPLRPFADSRWTLSGEGAAAAPPAEFAATAPGDVFADDGADDGRPRFSAGPWSTCSVTCGAGLRMRAVTCVARQGLTADVVRLPDHECDGQTKPELFQPCQLAPCRPAAAVPAGGNEPSRFAELAVGALDEVAIPGERALPPQPSARRTSPSGAVFHWEYADWTLCSAPCLGGHQKSTLKCVDVESRTTVDASYCDAAQRPVEMTRACNKQACPPDWEVGEFSACSHSCGGGVRSRRVRCTRAVSRASGAESTLILPEAQCPTPRPASDEPCGLIDCPPLWRLGRWSECSVSCGAGEQRRDVACEQRDALGVLHVFADDLRCAATAAAEDTDGDLSVLPLRPSTVRLCNLGPCSDSINSERAPWRSAAPVRGGSGRRHIADEDNRTVKQYRDVNAVAATNSDNDDATDASEGQPNHRKLTLDVGGFANLYEGTSVKVKCPVKNFSRDKIFWTKDGRRIANDAHMKVSANGALRIFHARIEDAGVFACFANGARGNVTLTFKPAAGNAIGADANRTQSRKQIVTNRTNMRGSGANPADVPLANASRNVRFSSDQLQKVKASLLRLGERRILERLERLNDPARVRLDFAAGEWSRCSQLDCTQADGAQVRMLRCRLYVAQLTAYVDDDICTSFGVPRPPATRPCADPRCPRWDVTEWSTCSASRCLRAGIALQKRVVKCAYGNGTMADHGLCDRDSRPKVKRECENHNCTAEWRTSPWGKCSKPCGDGGVQMRLLRCVWHGTRKAAGRHCDVTARPIAIRMCDARALKHAKCTPADEDEANKTAKFWKARASGTPMHSALTKTSNSSNMKLDMPAKPQTLSQPSAIVFSASSSPSSIQSKWSPNYLTSPEQTTASMVTTTPAEVLDYAQWKSRQLVLSSTTTTTIATPRISAETAGSAFVPPFKGWERWRGWRLYNWPAPPDVAALRRLHSN